MSGVPFAVKYSKLTQILDWHLLSPLFTKQMYHNLGIHWASSIPGFLALVCTPAPFIFHKYGKEIRLKCRYAAQAYEYGQIQRGR